MAFQKQAPTLRGSILCAPILRTSILVVALALFPFHAAAQQESQDSKEAIQLEEIAINAQNAGDFEVAAGKWAELVANHATFSRIGFAHLEHGKCLLNLEQMEQAIESFKTATRELPRDAKVGLPKAYLYLGFAQYRVGQNLLDTNEEKARTLLTTATQSLGTGIKSFPDYPETDQACYFQGDAFELLDRLEDAAGSYEKMFEANPESSFKYDGLFALGNVYERLGQYDKALTRYDEYIGSGKDKPDYHQVRFRKAATLGRLALDARESGDTVAFEKNLNTARTIYASLADLDDFDLKLDARFQQAICLHRLGDMSAAAKQFEIVANADGPDQARATVLAGRDFFAAGQIGPAKKYLQNSIDADNAFSSEAAHQLSRLYMSQDDPDAAFALASKWLPNTDDDRFAPELMKDIADAAFLIPEMREQSPELYRSLVKKFPDHRLAASALYNSAFASLELGKLDEALTTADEFEKSYEQSDFLPDLLEVRADALLLQDKFQKSEAVYDRLVRDFEDHLKSATWKVQIGLARHLRKDHDAAIEWLQPLGKEIENASLAAEANHWLGASYLAKEQFAKAEQALSESLQQDANSRLAADTMLALSRAQQKLGNDAAAAKTLTAMKKAFPEARQNVEATYQLAEEAFNSGEFEMAIEKYALIMADHADSNLGPFAMAGMGWSHLQLKQFTKAEQTFTNLMEQHADTDLAEQAMLGRGMSRRQLGEHAKAITDLSDFLKAVPDDPQIVEARYEMGLAQLALKENDKAIKTFSGLLSEHPEHRFADRFHYELAWLYAKSDAESDKEKSQKYFADLAENFPESALAPEASFKVGENFYQQKEYSDAVESFLRCRKSDGETSLREKAAYRLGWCHFRLDEFAKAAEAFGTQAEEFPDGQFRPEAMVMKGESHFSMDQMEEAFNAYTAAQEAITAAGNVSEQNQWLTRLHGATSANRTRRFEEAERFLDPLLESEASEEFKLDGWFQMGTSLRGQKNMEAALEAFGNAALDREGQIGAKARCMIGDVLFTQQKFDDAINQYKEVFYGYGGASDDADVDPWQAYAIYHAARCNFVRISTAGDDLKPKLIADATKLYENLISNYPEDKLVAEAEKDLNTLKQLR